MSNLKNPSELLAALLSGLSTGAISVIELEVDPNRPIEDQLEQLGQKINEKLEAEHRAHCTACRTAHEMEQPKTQASLLAQAGALRQYRHNDDGNIGGFVFAYDKETADKVVADLQKERDTLREQLQAIKDSEAAAGFNPNLGAPYGESKPVFHEIGSMVFQAGKPIEKTFTADQAEGASILAAFKTDPMISMLNMLTNGRALSELELRPVYDRREN